MSEAKRAESAFRHNKAPRIPRIAQPAPNRQGMFTAFGLWIICLALLAWWFLT
jgi:hypothetical protein